GQEEGEAPHCGTWTLADRVQDLERKEEEVCSQREGEKARGKASSRQREGLRTAAQEDAKQVCGVCGIRNVCVGRGASFVVVFGGADELVGTAHV
ncbi:unnamed protein product, partial [Ectocarpus sp. 8 AP-2014]